jgi:predicted ester cyclase
MPATPAEILRIWFERVWNQGDESTIDQYYAPTAVANGLPSAPIPGPEGFKPFFRAFRAAFPDIRVEVMHAISEGDLGVVHCRVTGTNTGELMGLAATNRSFDITGITMARVADGRIVEGWNSFDFMTMYQQLGIQAPPVAAG